MYLFSLKIKSFEIDTFTLPFVETVTTSAIFDGFEMGLFPLIGSPALADLLKVEPGSPVLMNWFNVLFVEDAQISGQPCHTEGPLSFPQRFLA